MKRLIKTFFSLAICAVLFCYPMAVKANEVKTLDATSSDGKISVEGTTAEGTLACAVFVYDSEGDNLIAMETCEVKADNTFSYTFTNKFDDAIYVVKAADYDGGAFVQTTVKVDTTTTTPPKDSSKPDEPSKTDTTTTTAQTPQVAATASSDSTQLSQTSPKTGDTTNYSLIIAALIAGCGMISCTGYLRKKTR